MVAWYGPRRILSVSEGPKDLEGIDSAFAGVVPSEVSSIGASSGITCIGAAPSAASDTALARRLACSEPGAIAEFEPSSVSPDSAVDDGFVEVCSVVLLLLELIVSSDGPCHWHGCDSGRSSRMFRVRMTSSKYSPVGPPSADTSWKTTWPGL